MSADLPASDCVINGTTYAVTRMTMRAWYDFSALVTSMAGPTIAELLAGSSGSILDADVGFNVDPRSLGKAIFQLCDGMTAKNQEKLVKSLSAVSTANGQPIDPDWHWPRNMADLVPWLAHGIGWQLADFFVGARDIVPGLPKKGHGSLSA